MDKILLPNKIYLSALIYFIVTTLLHWGIQPQLNILYYYVGGLVGLHLLEIASMIDTTDQPLFRTALIQVILVILTIFVLTSSGSLVGAGVVLFLNLRYLWLQYMDFNQHRLNFWFRGGTWPITETFQRTYLCSIFGIFIIETILFLII